MPQTRGGPWCYDLAVGNAMGRVSMESPVQIDRLIERKRALENMIASESERPNPDSLRISDLKKQKLRLKEQISELEHH
jgi:hypothetical protein